MRSKSGICITCHNKRRTGTKNPSWKGGKTRHSRGYILEKLKDHPRSTKSGVYVLQHIIVMEDILGRYLINKESIHHKNGIKDDNRPENLELWASNHPSGQRIEDLVSWAKEILKKYDPDVLKEGI